MNTLRVLFFFTLAILFASCNPTTPTAPSKPIAETVKPFQYTTLPNEDTWQIHLGQPMVYDTVNPDPGNSIYSTFLPKEIAEAFPLPGWQDNMPMVEPGTRRTDDYGFGFNSMPSLILDHNKVAYNHCCIISGGGYSTYMLRELADPSFFNPFEHGYLIKYQGQVLAIEITDSSTLQVAKLKKPELGPRPQTLDVPKFGKKMVFE